MLKPDDARRKLGKFKSEKQLKARLARLQKLPKAAAAAGLGLFKLLPDGKEPKDWRSGFALQNDSGRILGADAGLRKKVLTTLYPTFAKEIELAFRAMERLPYTMGQNRRPFRAPSRPEFFAAKFGAFLQSVNDALGEIADDALTPEWVAAWAIHLHYDTSGLGYLFAGQIDAGRDDVLEILKDSAANRHATGGPGRHAVRGLLCCQKPEAWQFVANLLLAAQRQEGLRQSILESADEAHPKAFRQLLGIVLDQNLIRFAAAARAASVWLGEELMVDDAKALKAALGTVQDFLDSPAARAKALKNGDAASLYRALWTLAFEDVAQAVAAAKPVLKEKNPGRKFAAVKLLFETSLSGATDLVLPLLADDDPAVLSTALAFFTHFDAVDWVPAKTNEIADTAKPYPAKLFDVLEKLLPNLPDRPEAVKSPVPSWKVANLSRQTAANLLVECLQNRPAERLLPHMKAMSPQHRVSSLAHLCRSRTLTTKVRGTLMACAAETNTQVREAALGYLKKCTLAEDEVRTLEGLLTRKQPDFRRGVFELLLNRTDKLALQSVERLLPGDALQRAAGIELARRMTEANRIPHLVSNILAAFREQKGTKLPEADGEAIHRILNPEAGPATLENGLGLFDPKDRSSAVAPRKLSISVSSSAAFTLLKQLDAFVYEHRDETFTKKNYMGRDEEVVLGSIQYLWEFPPPEQDRSADENFQNLPLRDLWFDWFENRPTSTRDEDGLELVRAALMRTYSARDGEEDRENDEYNDDNAMRALREFHPEPPVGLRHEGVVTSLVQWFLLRHMPEGGIDFALDAVEQSFAVVPQSVHDKLPKMDCENDDNSTIEDWREHGLFTHTYQQLSLLKHPPHWTPAHAGRLYKLLRWMEAPVSRASPNRANLLELLEAYDAGEANLADFYDHLIGVRRKSPYSYIGNNDFDSLETFTRDGHQASWKSDYEIVSRHSELKDAVERVVARVMEIEVNRGETATAASSAVSAIGSIRGIEPLFSLIAALGKSDFKSTYWNAGKNKPESLTKLISVISPANGDTPEVFARIIKPWLESGKIDQEKLVALGMVNTKLIQHVSAMLNWPGYDEACYWFMAHASGSHAYTLQMAPGDHEDDHAKAWRAIVKARSNLSAEQRADGVIDVDWFHKAYRALGSDDRWDAIEKAARFLGYGHAEKKAARLADVLLGRTRKKELVDNIQKKFLKESVRLLGLLPLPKDEKKRDAELADRYKVLKAYERYARGLSSLSKEPAMQSYRLGMENLAVTAGYSDPVRLEWAVTAKETADLAQAPATAKAKGIIVSLKLGAFAEPETTQFRGNEELKSLPKEAKDSKAVAELLERKKDLKRLVSSTKRTLELAMCAGDRFTAAELQHLMTHPIVRPFLERLVLKSDAGMGYPVQGGKALRGADGETVPVKKEWAIAHSLDFVSAKNWHDFQAECFRQERVQPFKQVFREVYTLTTAEKEDGDKSRRYSGQQVNENQAKALLSGRGWSTKEDLSKLYHAENLNVELILDHGYGTPGDAAAPAVKEICFVKRGEWKPMLLADVPSIIFSEVMRDLDLVVSVAHVGGIDPEATQSTVAMRSTLLVETCALLKLDNVRIESRHALINGTFGQYSVHLGSGVVHKQPGGSLCVVAVNAQHRGRIFLPFADDDPRTAEILSKVLLLARDREIQDPTILEQIATR
jgi:hypothetical protein